jgi:hypothetical protein
MSLLGAFSLVSWKSTRFGPGLELMETYVSDIERDCAASVQAFDDSDDGYEQPVAVDEESGQVIHEWVRVHKGLDACSWSLSHIFHNYFPTLKRASALAMLCSFVEHEFNKLCEDIQKHLKVGIALSDIQGAGIERACRYFKVVGDLSISTDQAAWAQRADIFKVRNAMIHAGGRAKPDILNIIKKSKFLSVQEKEITISEGYLAFCISVFSAVGDDVGSALSERFEKEIQEKKALAWEEQTKKRE